MTEIISTQQQVFGEQLTNAVNARELHEFLGIGRRFTSWIDAAITEYGFIENVDYVKSKEQAPHMGTQYVRSEYHISIDMAKELSMVQKNEKGRQARRYFIEVEKKYRSNQHGWIEARTEGKHSRLVETDIIKVFIDYAKKQGSKNADKYYMIYTKLMNSQLFGINKAPKELRNQLSISQLHSVSLAENMIGRALLEGMDSKLYYKEIFQMAKRRVHTFALAVGITPIGMTDREMVGLPPEQKRVG